MYIERWMDARLLLAVRTETTTLTKTNKMKLQSKTFKGTEQTTVIDIKTK